MKRLLILLLLLFTCVSCNSSDESIPQGKLTYEGSGLSVSPPENWLMIKLPGNDYISMFTEIDYGIKPNIQLEGISGEADSRELLKQHLEEKKRVYPDYFVREEELLLRTGKVNILKIKAERVNVDKIPVVHFTYLLADTDELYILSATCAEPSIGRYEKIFDTVIRSAEISR